MQVNCLEDHSQKSTRQVWFSKFSLQVLTTFSFQNEFHLNLPYFPPITKSPAENDLIYLKGIFKIQVAGLVLRSPFLEIHQQFWLSKICFLRNTTCLTLPGIQMEISRFSLQCNCWEVPFWAEMLQPVHHFQISKRNFQNSVCRLTFMLSIPRSP